MILSVVGGLDGYGSKKHRRMNGRSDRIRVETAKTISGVEVATAVEIQKDGPQEWGSSRAMVESKGFGSARGLRSMKSEEE